MNERAESTGPSRPADQRIDQRSDRPERATKGDSPIGPTAPIAPTARRNPSWSGWRSSWTGGNWTACSCFTGPTSPGSPTGGRTTPPTPTRCAGRPSWRWWSPRALPGRQHRGAADAGGGAGRHRHPGGDVPLVRPPGQRDQGAGGDRGSSGRGGRRPVFAGASADAGGLRGTAGGRCRRRRWPATARGRPGRRRPWSRPAGRSSSAPTLRTRRRCGQLPPAAPAAAGPCSRWWPTSGSPASATRFPPTRRSTAGCWSAFARSTAGWCRAWRGASASAPSPRTWPGGCSVANIDAAVNLATRPGRPLGQVFHVLQEAYAREGYPDQWQNMHQGGSAGYATRETVATPGCPVIGAENQAFAWSPSVPGAVMEDTCCAPGRVLRC